MSGFILQAVSADDPGYWALWDGFDQGIGPDRVVLVEGGMGVVEIASSSGRQRTGSLSPRLWVCLAWPLVRSGQIQVLVSVWFPELGRVPYFWLLGWVPDTVWFNWCVPADCFFFAGAPVWHCVAFSDVWLGVACFILGPTFGFCGGSCVCPEVSVGLAGTGLVDWVCWLVLSCRLWPPYCCGEQCLVPEVVRGLCHWWPNQ